MVKWGEDGPSTVNRVPFPFYDSAPSLTTAAAALFLVSNASFYLLLLYLAGT